MSNHALNSNRSVQNIGFSGMCSVISATLESIRSVPVIVVHLQSPGRYHLRFAAGSACPRTVQCIQQRIGGLFSVSAFS